MTLQLLIIKRNINIKDIILTLNTFIHYNIKFWGPLCMAGLGSSDLVVPDCSISLLINAQKVHEKLKRFFSDNFCCFFLVCLFVENRSSNLISTGSHAYPIDPTNQTGNESRSDFFRMNRPVQSGFNNSACFWFQFWYCSN
jgi:hypothetical protein